MTLAERERAYSPSSMIGGDMAGILTWYRDESTRVRARYDTATHRYGPSPDEQLDLYLPAVMRGPVPLHVFVHGGYWQELSRLESSFMAGPLLDRGAAVAVVDYTLAPRATLETMITQCQRAVGWCATEAGRLGIDSTRIILSGSSAGGHLAAMVLTQPSAVSAAVLFSGIFELEPLIGTYINVAVGIDQDVARRCSPIHLRPARSIPLVVATGAIETPEFQRQSDELAGRWQALGCAVSRMTVPGRNHFDVPLELSLADSPVGSAVLTFEGHPQSEPTGPP